MHHKRNVCRIDFDTRDDIVCVKCVDTVENLVSIQHWLVVALHIDTDVTTFHFKHIMHPSKLLFLFVWYWLVAVRGEIEEIFVQIGSLRQFSSDHTDMAICTSIFHLGLLENYSVLAVPLCLFPHKVQNAPSQRHVVDQSYKRRSDIRIATCVVIIYHAAKQ